MGCEGGDGAGVFRSRTRQKCIIMRTMKVMKISIIII